MDSKQVFESVAETFGYPVDVLLGDSMAQPVALARQVAMYACRTVLGMSYPKIGAEMHRDHTTIRHGCKRIEKLLEDRPELREQIAEAAKPSAGKLKRIHVNQHVIKANAKHGKNDPVLTVKEGKLNTYGHRVEILDKNGCVAATVVYQPNDPLSCGARVWISTRNEVRVLSDSETTTGDY